MRPNAPYFFFLLSTLITGCLGDPPAHLQNPPQPVTQKPSFPVTEIELPAEPVVDPSPKGGLIDPNDPIYQTRSKIRDCLRHTKWVQRVLSAPYLTDAHREQIDGNRDDESLILAQALSSGDGSPKWVDERERRLQFFMDLEEMRFAPLDDDADIETLETSLTQCQELTLKVKKHLFPPAPDQLWDTAPDFVRQEVQAFHDRYWTPSAFDAPMAWGTCQVEGVDEDCSWFCWTNTDSLQQCSFSVVIPDQVQRKFNLLGTIEIEKLPNGRVLEDKACYSNSNKESGTSYLAISSNCLGDAWWADEFCSEGYQDCDRMGATEHLIAAINQSGVWEMKIEQHLISDRPMPTQ